MAITSGFFDHIKSDRGYDAHQLSDIFSMLIPNGIASGIGNGFACESTDDINKIKIRSGFGFFNGYYIYNDSEIEFTIDESVYPAPGLRNIQIKTLPNQIDYPAGNALNLDGISVVGLKSYATVDSIRIEENPQLDYPYGSAIDLGNIKVVGDLAESVEVRVGDCYIVIEFNEFDRKFEIKAINTNDFKLNKDYIIAICHKTVTGLRVENVVGKTLDDIDTPQWITGLFQSIFIDDVIDSISYSEDTYRENFDTEKTTYWNNWISNNAYYLHSSGNQYNRLVNELSTKENSHNIRYETILKDTTEMSIYIPELTNNSTISLKINPYGLILKNMEITDTNYLHLTYELTKRSYSLCIIIR